jgi:hypothetical protein
MKSIICPMVKNITSNQLRLILSKINHIQNVDFAAYTKADTRNDPPFDIMKYSKIKGSLGIYETAVNRERVEERKKPTFKSGPRVWGEKISLALVKNKGKFFLPVIVKNKKPSYIKRDKNGMLIPITYKNIRKYLNKSKPKNQGLKNVVQVRAYNLDNITEIKIGEKEYIIKD